MDAATIAVMHKAKTTPKRSPPPSDPVTMIPTPVSASMEARTTCSPGASRRAIQAKAAARKGAEA